MVIFTSSPGTQNKIAYEKEMLSTPKDAHRQGRAGLKSWVPGADARWLIQVLVPDAATSRDPWFKSETLLALTHTELYVGQPIAATLNTSPARQELSNSKPDQSLLSPSAAMTGLNPKCILHTQSSSLIFTATCFNSSLSRCARQTGTQESASVLKIISRPSSANVDNQIY